MKKIFLFLFFLLSCQNNQNVFLVGEFGSLTGDTATFGRSTHDGVMMALEEVNAQGGLLGKQVKVITEDDMSKPEEAKTAVLKLIKRNKVKAIIGEVASSRSLAAAPEAQKAKVPMISPASTNPGVTQVGDYIFRACFIDSFQGEAMAKFAFNKLAIRKVAIFKDIKNDYSVGLAQFFEKTFRSLGGEVVSAESYSEGDIEFRAQLTNMKTKNPEALFIPGYYTEVGLISRQARELGLNVPLLGGDGWDSPKTIEIGGVAMNGSYFSNHYSLEDPSPIVRNFIEKYKQKHGIIPDAMAVLGYDAAHILFDAIKRAGDEAPEKIREALARTKNFQGVSGTISMDENRNAIKKLVVMKIDNGAIVFQDVVNP
ncbi:MAG TPA: ethanolamine utilization protein EutJ [Deltaproteobacteria bacterium]|nr:MAG: ethanolamine utilization protein EutJ [Deltaproteobacteria bacterium GWA2_45_12]HBF12617.1 ethanolamine utilization protein EutJ [Deltaproteobacteria bacterium]